MHKHSGVYLKDIRHKSYGITTISRIGILKVSFAILYLKIISFISFYTPKSCFIGTFIFIKSCSILVCFYLYYCLKKTTTKFKFALASLNAVLVEVCPVISLPLDSSYTKFKIIFRS